MMILYAGLKIGVDQFAIDEFESKIESSVLT